MSENMKRLFAYDGVGKFEDDPMKEEVQINRTQDGKQEVCAATGEVISKEFSFDKDAIGKVFKTKIEVRDLETHEKLGPDLENKVILPGSGFIARALFDINQNEITPSYNAVLGLDPAPTSESTEEATFTTADKDHPKVLLFCIGTDGCGSEGSQVYTVPYNGYITPEGIIPFRYPLVTNDLDGDNKQLYTGRRADGDYVAYYFKRFSSGPSLTQQYLDGTPIEADVLSVGEEVETYVEMVLTITKEDCREFFIATTGIDEARFNSISLCYAYPIVCDGIPYFMDIHPFTRLNIPNEYLIDATKGVEIIYHIYM